MAFYNYNLEHQPKEDDQYVGAIVSNIMDTGFDSFHQSLDKSLKDIHQIVQSRIKPSDSHLVYQCFWYKGVPYIITDVPSTSVYDAVNKELPEDLNDDMDLYLTRLRHYTESRSYILAYVSDVVFSTNHTSIVKRLLHSFWTRNLPHDKSSTLMAPIIPIDVTKVQELEIKHAKAIEAMNYIAMQDLLINGQ